VSLRVLEKRTLAGFSLGGGRQRVLPALTGRWLLHLNRGLSERQCPQLGAPDATTGHEQLLARYVTQTRERQVCCALALPTLPVWQDHCRSWPFSFCVMGLRFVELEVNSSPKTGIRSPNWPFYRFVLVLGPPDPYSCIVG